MISPTFTPAMLTVCPWPGVTDCAVEKSTLYVTKSEPTNGTHLGRYRRWLDRM